jgi:hypothetical protein
MDKRQFCESKPVDDAICPNAAFDNKHRLK